MYSNRLTQVISPTSFLSLNPGDYEYLIVASSNLLSASGSIARYKASTLGGTKTLNMDVRDVYNLFNYGEPSLMTIRRFVNYVFSEGVSNKSNLLLVGTSYGFRDVADTSGVNGILGYSPGKRNVGTLKTFKELPTTVPTLGEPGNGNLLTTGIGTAPDKLPGIPVGRISADSAQQVLNYLSKIIEYEQDSSS